MRDSGHYLLASEFTMLMAVWLGPPLLIAFGIQAVALIRRGRSRGVLAACFVVTAIASAIALIGLLVTDWPAMKRFNTALMLPAPHELWLMPIAFPVVGAIAVLVAFVFAGWRRT